MIDFDVLIVGDWPKGFYLAQQFSLKNEKVAYIELTPFLKNPFPVFLNESYPLEKVFLENLGFLSFQEGGLCFLTSEEVSFFQERKRDRNLGLSKTNLFKKEMLSYLSSNLTSKVFEFNNSYLSEESLDLFSDCFLFEPSLRKKEEIKKKYPKIHFFSAQTKDLLLKDKQIVFQDIVAKKTFCLTDRIKDISNKADWKWRAYFFQRNLDSYESILPKHFLCIKNFFSPWCYDNLMSVFLRGEVLEVWMRLPLTVNQNEFVKKAQNNLESFFPGAEFHLRDSSFLESFCIYGKTALEIPSKKSSGFYVQNCQDFFQGDLVHEINSEIKLWDKLQKS
ncbi:MAG: hypothetical protein GDA46_00950 [Bdellovibrionales bacterium]|nr:hypothetical protein [Bdellovibrionales bacterium]